ncbi:MAG: Gx transporter family protein [Anaerosomatales bacterium]|nr:Gx transporter family protein [Anaerosomatales bacterium]
MRSSADVMDVPAARPALTARTVAIAGLLAGVGVVLGLVEQWVGLAPLPWLRLGIANIVVVLGLRLLGPRAALGISLARWAIVGLLTGTLAGPTGGLALCGAIAAWAAMSALSLCGARFSVVGWSVLGAVAHSTAQFSIASVLAGSVAVLTLYPLSAAASLLFGLATGFVARLLLSRVSTVTG